MTVRVGINGFGRIGRNFFRAVLDTGADVEVVGVNDLTSPETLAHLLRYDSTQGRLPVPVDVEGSDLLVGDQHIRVMAEREPEKLPWDRARGRRGDRVDRALHQPSRRGEAPGRHGEAGHHLGAVGRRRRHVRHRRQRRGVRPREGRRGLERVVHHELLRAHGQGDRRRVRDRERSDDDRPRLHERPEPARPDAHGPAPSAAGRGQHRAEHRRAPPGRPASCSPT